MSNSLPVFEKLTIPKLREFAKDHDISVPSKATKAQIIQYIKGMLATTKEETNNTVTQLSTITPVTVNSELDWLEHLQEYGWSVVPIDNWNSGYTDMFFNWLESCVVKDGNTTTFQRHDIDTWKRQTMPPMLHGIFKHYLGHTEMQWQIRELCLPYFERIWQTDDLLCSFDGGCLLQAQADVSNFKQWIHCDQPRNMPGFCCIQGVVNFEDCGPEDGGLVLLDKSHLVWNNYMERHPAHGIFWGPADLSDPDLQECQPIKICAPAGSLILFDSRLMHCNMHPTGSIFKDDKIRYRMCTYVSMQPRAGATDKELKQRITAYEKGRLTGHWCYGSWFSVNAENGFHTGTEIKPAKPEIAQLNPVRARLIGY